MSANHSLQRLLDELGRLPGIGPKSAQRIAYYLLEADAEEARRLAEAIQKTQKRANALGNVQIPQMQKTIKSIDEVLSEREREEFSRLKVIKAQKEKEEA